MIAIAAARPDTTLPPRQRRALTLSAALHAVVAAAWLIAPTPSHDLGAGALTVQLLVETPPAPEPPAPEPPRPEAAQPEPKPELPKPETPKPLPAKPTPRPAPRAPAPTPAQAAAVTENAPAAPAATNEPAQPVMSSEPAEPAAAASAPAAPAVSVGAPNARNVERDDYLRMVWSRIMRHRPARVPFAGLTRLRFTLATDGTLVDVEVAETSGSGVLDRAALDAVRQAAPFPPPPPLSADALRFEIPFQFR